MIIRVTTRCLLPCRILQIKPRRHVYHCCLRKNYKISNKRCYSKQANNVIVQAVNAVRNNVTGYTKVLLVVMGIMIVIVIIAEATIANDTIILNTFPQKPNHTVFSYPGSVFKTIQTPKQFLRAETQLINIHGGKGCGKTEFIRQYCEKFIQDGPHFYYKLHKLSNRRNCQVFVVDARTKQTLGHSLASLSNKLKQGNAKQDELCRSLEGIKAGLKKLSRWLIVFEDVSSDLDIMELFNGFEDWGDGQIILTSECPVKNCSHTFSLSSLVPQNVAKHVFSSIVSSDDPTFNSVHLDKLFGSDLRSTVTAAYCIKLEQESGNDFQFHELYQILSASENSHGDVIKLYCGLLSLKNPMYLFALDFIGRLPHDTPIPYEYIKHHITSNMYNSWSEPLYNYREHRNSKMPKSVIEDVKVVTSTAEPHTPVDPETLSLFGRYRHEACINLGLDPELDLWPQLQSIYEIISPKPMDPPEDSELTFLKECCLLKFEPLYGGHVPVFNVDKDIHSILASFHSDFTAHLLEAALVFEQDRKFNRTWISRFWNFQPHEQTFKARATILGKTKVHKDPKNESAAVIYHTSPPIYDSVLEYRALPISHANIAEYNDLHTKQVLKSLMSFIDVTIPNTIRGTLQCILLHQHLSAISNKLSSSFSGLAETCSLHLKSELGQYDMEHDFKSALSKAKAGDFKGPSHASALHRYSVWLSRNSRSEEAKLYLDEAVKFADSLALNRTMAQVCCELESYESAEKYLEKSLRLIQPGDESILGPLLTDLGQVLLLRGKTVLGIQCVQKAIEGYKNMLGTENPEYARSLNVVSIGHLMLGDNIRSTRARNEASNVLAKLKKKNIISA